MKSITEIMELGSIGNQRSNYESNNSLLISEKEVCEKCGNTGRIFVEFDEGAATVELCSCQQEKILKKRLLKSGMVDLVKRFTLENFIVTQDFQQAMVESAREFLEEGASMFYISGQSGCGKTHLCVSIVSKLLAKYQYQGTYVNWVDFIDKIRYMEKDQEEYRDLIHDIKTIQVLYIDDFLKAVNTEKLTEFYLSRVFEIIDYRYRNQKLITVISTEKSIQDIAKIDQAIAGRIYERSGNFNINISNSSQKNYRLK